MDISVYITELMYEHDCVIIPGFGGFILNYKPAEIHPIEYTVSPPSKAMSFNRNLRSNDGLLINHIANNQNVSFDVAYNIVNTWVTSAKNLLNKNEDFALKKVGRFHTDIEGNFQFTPDESVNYLKSAFGLRTIIAEPMLRGKEINLSERIKTETGNSRIRVNIRKIAAMILLIAAIGGIIQLMWSGVEIKKLNLDEAGVFNFVNNIFKPKEPELKPIPVEIESAVTTAHEASVDNTVTGNSATLINPPASPPTAKEETYTLVPNGHAYFIIIGAFTEQKNIEGAKSRLQQRFSDSEIIVEKHRGLTYVGYSVGNNYNKAEKKLHNVQSEDATYWLFKK